MPECGRCDREFDEEDGGLCLCARCDAAREASRAKLIDRRGRLLARVAELEAALEPFAEKVVEWKLDHFGGDANDRCAYIGVEAKVFRAAAKAMKGE